MSLRKKKALSYIPEEAEGTKETATVPVDDLEVEEIYAQILKLPNGYRTVFNLYVIEGYNHKEISMQLGILKILLNHSSIKHKEGISYDK